VSSPLAEVRLRDLLLLADSGTWGDEGKPENGWPVLRSTNIQDSSLILHDVAWRVVPEKDEARCKLQENDILVTKSSGSADLIGKCCVIRDLGETEFLFSNFMLRLRVDPAKTTFGWIFYWLTSQQGRARLAAMNTTTTGLRNLNVGRYLDQKVPLPPIEEQRRIASILDKAEAIRRKRRQAAAVTEALLRSAFLDMFGDPITNPKQWSRSRLSNIAEITTGNTPSRAHAQNFGTDIEWIKSDNITTANFYLTAAAEGLSRTGAQSARIAGPGAVLVTCIAGSLSCIGNAAIADREVAFNQQINAIIPHNHDALAFLYEQTLLMKSVLQAASTGGMKGMLSKGRLSNIEYITPPSSLIAKFGQIFASCATMQQRTNLATREADALFESLTHQAVTGHL
jgi:type I restriction enzyme S subunit